MTDKEIGVLQADNKTTKKNVEGLFDSNEKRKEEINALKLQLGHIESTVDETNTTVNGVAASMEKFTQEVRDYMAANDVRMSAIEKRLPSPNFDVVKVFKWLGTTRGLIFMIFLIGVLNPASQDFILELFGNVLGSVKVGP